MPAAAEGAAAADLLVVGGDVLTMDPGRRILSPGAVAIMGERIVAIGAPGELRRLHPGAPELDATGGVVTPGLVNAHQHLTGDPLIRSTIPDDLPPGASVFLWAVPVHAAHTPDDDELSATLACADMARLGTTTVVEAGTVAHPGRVAAGIRTVGLRATLGTWGWDVEGEPFAAPATEVLDRQRAVLDAYPLGGDVEGWVTLVGHSLASDELLAGAAELARSAGTGMTMHLSPTTSDPEAYLERTGRRPVVHLDELDVLGPHLLLAHAVHLDDDEVGRVLATRTAVAACPWAYLRLGQGVSVAGRHADLVEAGGRVALGCDAHNAADAPDVLRAAALFAGLAKDTAIDPTRLGASTALELATIRGAEAIGMGDRIGSLEPGKLADLVVHDATGIPWAGTGDPAMALVWGVHGTTVRDVLVGGRRVVADGRCTGIDESELVGHVADARRALLARAGLPA